MVKQLTFLVFLSAVLISCEPKESEVKGPPEPVNPPVNVEEIEVPKQTNVVTPEFWNAFETDVKIVFFYSKIQSSPQEVLNAKIKVSALAADLGYEFHEYHTDENMGMVQVDDNLFFDLTQYLISSDEGFLMLKHGDLKHIQAGEIDSESGLDAEIKSFY